MIKQANRTGFIGSSDIASIMGMSRWSTPLQLWAEKTGEVAPPDLSNKEYVQLGTELEDFVAKKFQKETGMKVRRAPKIYQHKEHEFFKAQVDRLIEGTDELLECKTCSGWKAKEWDGDEIPQEYILQVLWQLGITGRSVGWIAVLIGGQSFRHKRVEFDKELFDKMIEQALIFWKCVEDGTPPMAMGLDNPFMVEIFPESDDQIQLVEEMNDSIAMLQQIKGTINEAMKQKDEIEAKIKQVIGSSLGIRTNEYEVTWKAQSRSSVDVNMLRHDGLYDAYAKESSTRVLRVRKGKDNGNSN